MKIQLSEHFTYKKLLRFVIPSIIMMIFTSVYGVVDGLFVSNFAGKEAFSAINIIMPFLMILGTIGFMLGAGGSAIVSKTLGEGDKQKAREYFSMFVYVSVILGVIFSIAGIIFLRPISILLGASESMIDNCVLYGRIILISLTAFILQNIFQSFLVTAERPKIGLLITTAAGVTNMVLDFLFVGVFKWGITGAAVATSISQLVGGIVPLIYFASRNSSLLRLTKAKFNIKIFTKACTNGSSELMTNVSLSLVNMLYNFQLMRIDPENGVAAYGVIMYAGFIFVSIFIGYSIGMAPLAGYNYGAQNHNELKNIFRKSLVIISLSSVAMTLMAELAAYPLAKIFVGYDSSLLELSIRSFRIYSISFLLCGMNIFGSAFFTALGNGAVSAAISVLRTLLFQVICVLFLPEILAEDGIWLSSAAAELLSLAVTSICLVKYKSRYKYA